MGGGGVVGVVGGGVVGVVGGGVVGVVGGGVSVEPGVEEGLEPTMVAGPGVLAAGLGEFGLGAGLETHSEPKSGHVTPEKYIPITVPRINKQQHTTMTIITPVCIPKLRQGFFKDSGHL